MPKSDMKGRSFEFLVTESIFSEISQLHSKKVKLTSQAKTAQKNGRQQFEQLEPKQKKKFDLAGKKIAEWLVENKLKDLNKLKFEKSVTALDAFFVTKTSSTEELECIEIDRIPDSAGVKGDVTDIRIKVYAQKGVAIVNVSLKHRHEALKHPRLTRVPNWISLQGTEDAKEYRKQYEEVWKNFFEIGKKIAPTAKLFSDLKAIDKNVIDEKLYKPLYSLVESFITDNTRSSDQVKNLFNFMVGKFDFIKFVSYDDRIEVRDFSNIPQPNSVKMNYPGDLGYLYFIFDNGWTLSGRLHTASEGLKKSIKFDIRLANPDVVAPLVCVSTISQTLG